MRALINLHHTIFTCVSKLNRLLIETGYFIFYMSQKPKVLILGGTGFVGRNLVRHLVSIGAASLIRVSDKNRPEMSWFSAEDKELFANPCVEYIMSNLVNQSSVEKAFTLPEGEFDYVIDLASTGSYGQEQEFYDQKVIAIVKVCGAEAKKRNIKKWIEVSSSQVYDETKKPAKETDKTKPWTSLAVSKLKAEQELAALGIPHVILRPAIIYGPGDITGFMPRVVIGAVYKHSNEKMKLLWTGTLEQNTVHVNDVVRAIWFLIEKGKNGEVYNVVDTNGTNQEKMNEIIGKLFGIKTGFIGSVVSNLAKIKFKEVVADVNEGHMEPWGEMIKKAGITRSPISPFLEPELLAKNPLNISGSKLADLGFELTVPAPTVENVRESLNYWIEQKVFPVE